MNTRINPTTNGLMHLGHAYLALVNYHMAKSTGGTFTLRCEDNQEYWLQRMSFDEMKQNGELWKKDLEWLGIPADFTWYESQFEDTVRKVINDRYEDCKDTGTFMDHPVTPTFPDQMYPYDLYLISKVRILDSINGIDCLICGLDLLPRYALYVHLGVIYNLPMVKQIFLPRLTAKGGIDDVSKTKGNYKIDTYRKKGWQPEDVIYLLRQSCLKDEFGNWTPENIYDNPTVLEERKVEGFNPVGLTQIDPESLN